MRGEWPDTEEKRAGSSLPVAGASTGRLLRTPNLRALESGRRLRGPRPRRAQPRWLQLQWLETPSRCSHLNTSYHHRSPLPGPACFFPGRTCQAGPPSPSFSPPPNPHFRFSSSPWQLGQCCLRHCTILLVATLSEGGPGDEETVAHASRLGTLLPCLT